MSFNSNFTCHDIENRRHAFVDIRFLREAVEKGDVKALETLLVDVIDMHMKADLLASAVKLGRKECLNSLLNFGADPFLKQSDTRRTALYWAVLKDDAEALSLLLRNIHRDPVDVVLELSSLANNSPINRSDETGTKSCYRSTQRRNQSKDFDVNYRALRAMNEALFEAASLGSLETAKYLLSNNADPNVFCYHDDEFLSWCTPLIAACFIPLNSFCQRTDIEAESMVKLLVEHGAEIGKRNYVGDTALHWAAACGLLEAVSTLLRNGADVNAQNHLKSTPIMTALDRNSSNCYDTILTLIDWGANINDIDRSGWSVLCYAVNSQNIQAVEKLLEKGALTDYDCEMTELVSLRASPLSIATSVGNFDLIKLLVRRGANVDRKAGSISNPLSHFSTCLEMSCFELATFYLDAGADRHDAWTTVETSIKKTLGGLPDSMIEYLKPSDRMKLDQLQKLKSILSNPMSLKSLCRLTIISRILPIKVRLLPLPSAIQSYLYFDE